MMTKQAKIGDMPTDRLLTLRQVMAMTNFGSSTIYRWIKDKKFPAAISFSEKAVRWRESTIINWINDHDPNRPEIS